MTRIRWIPAIIALAVILYGPFGYAPTADSDPRGGLICYCSAMGKICTMISCSGCGPHAGASLDRWSPEMLLEPFPAMASLEVMFLDRESSPSPAAIYLEVPDEPPNRI